MKKTFLIFAVGAMGLTVVNAQQQTRMDRMDRSHQEITHQLSDGVQLADLPDEMKERIDDMIGERDAQLVSIDRAGAGDGYELTFRSGERNWKQKFSREGRTEGGETRIDNTQRQGQMGTQGGQRTGTQTQGQTQTQQRTQGVLNQAGQMQDEQRARLEGATRIQDRDLPRNIRNTIDRSQEDRDAQITSIERGTRDGQDNYDITFNRDNRTYTRSYGADGREIQTGGTDGQTRTGGTTGGQTQTGGTTGGQTRTGTGTTGGQTQTGGTTGGQTQTGGTTGGQTRTGTGTTGGQTQTGGTTGGQTQTGGTTGGQTRTGTGTTGGQTQTGGTTGTQTQTGGTTGTQTQTGQTGQRTPLEGARRMETRDMPRNIQGTIDRSDEDRDAEVTSIERGTRGGQDNYDVTFRRDNRTWTRTYGADGREVQTGGTTGGQNRTGTTGGQTQTGGTTGGQTQTGGTTGGQTQTGGTTGGQTQTGGTTGGQTQTGGTTGGNIQTGGNIGTQHQRTTGLQTRPLEGARRMESRDLPRNIQNTIQQSDEDRGAQVTSIQRGTRDGQDNYDITFSRDNRTWTRTYDREGRMIPDNRDDN